MDPIKADDGNHLKVALFDENNAKVTFGPLSSASVEIVVLHGDFNNHDLDYWTREEFSRSVVCPHPGKEASVLGGDCILVLVDGEACLSDAFFHKTSFCARTGKFKMGVMLASAQYERIQEGISEPFLVKHRPLAALPPGSRLHRQTYTEEKQIVRYMCHRATGSKRQCYPHHSGSKRQRVLLERMTTQQKQQKLPNIAAGDRRALGTKNNVNDASSSSAGFTLFFYGPVALPVTASCSLLQRCFFCQAELFQDRALYMYRGDRAFCSQTCRRKHIRREAMDCARVAAAGSSLHRRQQPLMG
ncbi:hypothetical protein BS78_05G255700 [Paspalum vaginatum]|nr:hypothetical protein BS78_05G255700 [Paspalum vaginatum]